MIKSITFSKKTMATHGTLVISIPPEIIEEMELGEGEMVEVRLTKKLHLKQSNSPVPYHVFVRHDCGAYVPTDQEIAEAFL